MSKRKILNFVLFAVFTVAVFFTGVTIGVGRDVSHSLLNSSGSVDITKVVNLYSNSRSNEVDFKEYWDIWDKIKKILKLKQALIITKHLKSVKKMSYQ